MLEILCDFHGSSVNIEQISSRERAVDVPEVRADTSRIRSELGWQPKYSLEESLKWLWDLAVESEKASPR
jgi:nucleoside-diphosphate-sugar epimerase